MEHMSLGQVRIGVQNEWVRNEDVYTIDREQLLAAGLQQPDVARKLVEQLDEPERYVVYQDGQDWGISTKQPDAVLQLAVELNKKQGMDIRQEELQQLRQSLIRKQQ